MGHKAGTGLGKHAQGRVDIVESSMQKGRRGLGVSVAGFEVTNDQWDFEKEEVSRCSSWTQRRVHDYPP